MSHQDAVKSNTRQPIWTRARATSDGLSFRKTTVRLSRKRTPTIRTALRRTKSRCAYRIPSGRSPMNPAET
jgi:hypothetical protein